MSSWRSNHGPARSSPAAPKLRGGTSGSTNRSKRLSAESWGRRRGDANCRGRFHSGDRGSPSAGEAERKNSGFTLPHRAYDIFYGPGGSAWRADVQGPSPGGRGDQRHRGAARQAQNRGAQSRRGRRRRWERQGAAPVEATGEDQLFLRHHLERQYAGARARRRGAQGPDDLRRRVHGFPVRQSRAESALHLPHHQHPVG